MTDRFVLSDRERDAVLRLDAVQRYNYFIKRVADWEAAWGLWNDGWALAGDEDKRTGFPLWPAREYAQACAVEDWTPYRPKRIALADLMSELLVRLQEEGVLVAVFPIPSGKGMLVEPREVAASLCAECQQYE